jgi:uncharacterized protein (TIGR02118 family)
MLKVIFLFRFQEGRDPEEVRSWWLNEHSQLALKNLGMRRYVQNHFVGAIDAEHAESGMPFHGCVETWFEDQEAYERTMASPEWKALEEDGFNGLEMSSLMGGFVNEYVMRWDAAPDQRPYKSAGPGPDPAS